MNRRFFCQIIIVVCAWFSQGLCAQDSSDVGASFMQISDDATGQLSLFDLGEKKTISFEQAISLIKSHQEDVQIANLSVKLERYKKNELFAQMLPSWTLTGRWSAPMDEHGEQSRSLLSALDVLKIDLSAWGEVKLQGSQVRAAKAQGSQVLNETLLLTAKAYFQTLHKRRLIDVALQQEKRFFEIHQSTLRRASLGLVKMLDAERAELQLILSKNEVRKAQTDYRQTLSQLGYLLGQKYTFEIEDPKPLYAIEDASLEQLSTFAFEHREDLLIRKIQLEKETQNQLLRGLSLIPTMQVGFESAFPTQSALASPSPFSHALAFTLKWPLFEGGRTAWSFSGAKVRREQAELRLAQLERYVALRIKGAVEHIQMNKDFLQTAESASKLAKKAQESAQRLFEVKEVSGLELIDAHVAYFSAEQDFLRAGLQVDLSRLDLLYALGNFYEHIFSPALPLLKA